MIAVFIGFALALIIISLARITRFDRDVSFYPMLLMFIASLYILFAIIEGNSILKEILIASLFFAIAICGAFKSLVIVGLGIALHGIYDAYQLISLPESVAPSWWPTFCATVDLVLGMWVMYLAKAKDWQVGIHDT